MFTADVIYGLKLEYGQPGKIVTITEVFDPKTGKSVKTESYFSLPNVIVLPETYVQALARTSGGLTGKVSQNILIDKLDIPAGSSIVVGQYVDYSGKRRKINDLDEDSPDAVILRVDK